MIQLSYAITQVFEPLDGFVCVVIQCWQASFESSHITVVDNVVHSLYLATVTMQGRIQWCSISIDLLPCAVKLAPWPSLLRAICYCLLKQWLVKKLNQRSIDSQPWIYFTGYYDWNLVYVLFPTVTPSRNCRLKLLKLERIKDYLLMEEEFIQNQERLKPQEEKQEVCFEKVIFLFHSKFKVDSFLS